MVGKRCWAEAASRFCQPSPCYLTTVAAQELFRELQRQRLEAHSRWEQAKVEQLLAACEAWLRCAAELQSSLPEAEAAGVVAQLVGAAVGASIAGLEYGLSWMQAKQPRPSPADGERLLAPSA